MLVCPLKIHILVSQGWCTPRPLRGPHTRSSQQITTKLRIQDARIGMPRTKDKRYAGWLRSCVERGTCRVSMDRFLRRDDQGVRWMETPPHARGDTNLVFPGRRGKMVVGKPYLDYDDSPGSAYKFSVWIQEGRLAKYFLQLRQHLTEGQRQRARMEKRNIRMFIRALAEKHKDRSDGISVGEFQEFMVRVAVLNNKVWAVPLPTDVQKLL